MFRARCKKRAGLLAGLSADTYIYQGQGGGGGVMYVSGPMQKAGGTVSWPIC